MYIPHGAVYESWTPEKTGNDFEMSRILSSLADYKSYMTVISDLRNKPAESLILMPSRQVLGCAA